MFGNPKNNDKGIRCEPLGKVCLVERGGSPRPICDYVTDSEDGINWIKIGDADATRYISHTEEKIRAVVLSFLPRGNAERAGFEDGFCLSIPSHRHRKGIF